MKRTVFLQVEVTFEDWYVVDHDRHATELVERTTELLSHGLSYAKLRVTRMKQTVAMTIEAKELLDKIHALPLVAGRGGVTLLAEKLRDVLQLIVFGKNAPVTATEAPQSRFPWTCSCGYVNGASHARGNRCAICGELDPVTITGGE